LRALGALVVTIAVLAPAGAAADAPSLASIAAISPTPPMGWDSWYRYKCKVNQGLIERTARALAGNGMYAAGYRYVNIDDCWESKGRSPAGRLLADPAKFPAGIAALASYVHARRLKLGIYLDAGTLTCTGFPGSMGHVVHDIATIAGWGVDSLKLDYCQARPAPAQPIYTAYHQAIVDSGRAIMLNICDWGYQAPWIWGPGVGNTWRTTGDYYTYGAPRNWWGAILTLLDLNAGLAQFARPGAFNDPNGLLIGSGALTIPEQRAQMSLWSIMAAPLIASGDMGHQPGATMQILTNADVIAVDQDPAGIQGTRVVDTPTQQVWQRPLADGSRVILFLNPTGRRERQMFDLAALGIAGPRYIVRDLWTGHTWHTPGPLNVAVGPHDVRMLRLTDPAQAVRQR
jgi:alpha-galactosidase